VTEAYKPKRPARSETISIRKLDYRVYQWGEPGAPVVFMLHGWADTGLSFQFLVDAFRKDLHLIAPDWRGFGDTEREPRGYWFPDYLADLDALFSQFAPQSPIVLLGHSMGGNIAALYAGVRPERVRLLVNLEGYGLKPTTPDDAPKRYRQWFDEQSKNHRYRTYKSFRALAKQLQKNDPWLSPDKALFIAHTWAQLAENGRVVLKADPLHKRVNPVLYRREEAKACWRNTSAPSIFLIGADSFLLPHFKEDALISDKAACYRDFQSITIPNAGHMLHHDQPERIAKLIESLLDG